MVFCALPTWDTDVRAAGGGSGWDTAQQRASGKQGNFCHPPCNDTPPQCATTSHGAVFRMILAALGGRCLTSARASLTGAEQCGVGSLASRFGAEAALHAQQRLPASW